VTADWRTGPRPFNRIHTNDYCQADGCYREVKSSSPYCARHHRQIARTGGIVVDERYSDRVSDSAGPECRICGRSVYEHGVTEFCLTIIEEAIA